MAENLFALLIPITISAFCWWMVLKPSARRKFGKSGYDFWRLDKEGRESWDAMQLAACLIGALFFSLVTIVFLVVAIIRGVPK
jgi:hypothetical protein